MVWVKLTVIFFTIASCGSIEYKTDIRSSNEYQVETPELQSYVDLFKSINPDLPVPIEKTGLVVAFGSTQRPTIGKCTLKRSAPPTITIDRVFWEKATSTQKESLMLHELGHCILRRLHNENKVNGMPFSLMHPTLVTGYYEKYPEYYQKELGSVYGDWIPLLEDITFECDGGHNHE